MARKRNAKIDIPTLEAEPYMTHTFRFTGNLSGLTSITNNSILGACGVVGTVLNTSVSYLWASFRIKRLRIWGVSDNGAVPTQNVTLVWQGASQLATTEKVQVVSSASISEPLHLDVRPPPLSQAAFWNIGSANTILSLQPDVGSYFTIDLTVDLKMFQGGFATSTANVATATVGELYYLALDGPSTNILKPVGLGTTH